MALYHNIEKACRVCLSADNKVYPVSEHGLAEKLFELTGIKVLLYDGLPQYLCVFCCERLRKSLGFKNTCKETYQLMVNQLLQGRWPSLAELKTFCTSNLVFHPTMTDVLTVTYSNKKEIDVDEKCIDLTDDNCDINKTDDNFDDLIIFRDSRNDRTTVDIDNILVDREIFQNDCGSKNKSDLKVDIDETDIDVKYDYTDFDKNMDFDEASNEIIENIIFCGPVKDDNNSDKQTEIKKAKGTKKEDDQINRRKAKVIKNETMEVSTEDRIKEFTNEYIDENSDNLIGKQKVLYEYILNKYIKDQENNDLISNNETEKDSTESAKHVEDPRLVESRKLLYQYIENKYQSDRPKSWQSVLRNLLKQQKLSKRQKYLLNKSQTHAEDVKNCQAELVILDREQQIQEILNRKESKKYKQSKFKCKLCYQGFSFAQTYQNHMAIHDNSRPFKCFACHITFIRKLTYKRHMYGHQYKMICKLCSHVTRSRYDAKSHYKTHLEENATYACEYCDRVFMKDKTRIAHVQIVHGAVKCDICFKGFTNNFGLNLHKIRSHPYAFKCSSCSIPFHNADALKVHRESLTDDGCGPHIRPCTDCGANFTNDDRLKQHMAEDHNGRRQQNFARRKPRLRRRYVTENITNKGKQWLLCEVCGADRFQSSTHFRMHQQIHTGEKPYTCDYCGQSFRLKLYLEFHISKHTGARPYKCKTCSKGFANRSNVKRHQSVHTEVRIHPCEVCNKMFKTKAEAKIHLRAVHLKLPAYCPVRKRERVPKKSFN